MKKTYMISAAMLFASMAATAQTLDHILQRVEASSLALRTYSAQCQASKLEAQTGLTLADPEVEFSYQWGSEVETGDKKTLSVTQRLDYATVFGLKRRQARSRDQLADIMYDQARQMLLFNAEQVLLQLTFCNRQVEQLQKRLATAEALEQKYERMVQQGEANKLELNKVALTRVEAFAELQKAKIERNRWQSELSVLCGGEEVDYTATEYPLQFVGGDATMRLSQQEEAVAAEQVRLAKAGNLPELTAGYASELTRAEKFRGITVGVSIPLWQNRKNVSRARAQQQLAQAATSEAEQRLAGQRRELQSRITELQQLVESLQSSLQVLDSEPLSQKALAAGEYSLVDYLNARTDYYDLQDKLLETELSMQQALAEQAFLN